MSPRRAPRWLVGLWALELVGLGAAVAVFAGAALLPSPATLQLAYVAIAACVSLSALNIALSTYFTWRSARNIRAAGASLRELEERRRG